MNTLQMIQQPPVIRKKGGKFSVKLSNVGNPDFRQDPDRPLPDTVCGLAHVESLTEARDLCLHYIAWFDLGGGNWSGGEVTRLSDGVVIGKFSYNGRLWRGEWRTPGYCELDLNGNPIPSSK